MERSMKSYYVPRQTMVIVISTDAPWLNPNFRVIKTKYDNTFEEDEVIIHPNSLNVKHNAKYAETVGAAYACLGYFGFKRDKHICLVMSEDVYIRTDAGMAKTELIDFKATREKGADE